MDFSNDQTYNRQRLCLRADAKAMGNKGNVVLYLDKDLVAKSKSIGLNLSKTFENHLKHLITQYSTCNQANNVDSTRENGVWWAEPDLNRRPLARKANVLTKLDDRPNSVPNDQTGFF
jgi:post-segregation antitoxin (ccd killing protein)